MTAYVFADIEVHNPQEYQEYVQSNSPMVQQHGGRFVARGGSVTVLEGDWTTHRMVLIEFPSVEAARAWYDSPEYQAIAPVRRRHARTHLLAILEGA
jgi:uncharacterized protein (DUF1330 family)